MSSVSQAKSRFNWVHSLERIVDGSSEDAVVEDGTVEEEVDSTEFLASSAIVLALMSLAKILSRISFMMPWTFLSAEMLVSLFKLADAVFVVADAAFEDADAAFEITDLEIGDLGCDVRDATGDLADFADKSLAPDVFERIAGSRRFCLRTAFCRFEFFNFNGFDSAESASSKSERLAKMEARITVEIFIFIVQL